MCVMDSKRRMEKNGRAGGYNLKAIFRGSDPSIVGGIAQPAIGTCRRETLNIKSALGDFCESAPKVKLMPPVHHECVFDCLSFGRNK